jgi:hypothetical protein
MPAHRLRAVTALIFVLAAPWASNAWSQSAGDLAKQTQNPVADLVSVPFQFNWSNGGAYGNRALYNLNFQPVMPLSLAGSWNLIARPVVPFLNIPVPGTVGPSGTGERSTGIGDIQAQLFVSPTQPGGLIWGLGPVVSLPTATNDLARTGAVGVGPTVVVLVMPGNFVTGVLANHLWKVSGSDDSHDLNQTYIQPFLNYNLPNAWAISSSPGITANWTLPEGEEWTVPVGLGVTKVTAIGSRPVSLGMTYFHNAVRPDGAPEDTYRLQASFLFPIRKAGSEGSTALARPGGLP